jgi:hypothetical protein
VPEGLPQARIYRNSTELDRRSTPALEGRSMINRAGATGIWSLAAIAETVDRGFDWGSAAIGVGAGAAIVLLIVALAAALRGRGNGSHPRGGNPS